MRSATDRLFMSYSHYCGSEIGSENELGWYGLVEIGSPTEQRALYAEDYDEEINDDADLATPGWYILKIDDLGFVYGVPYETFDKAEVAFDAVVDTYMRYYEEVGQCG